jgi:hypothetical protein
MPDPKDTAPDWLAQTDVQLLAQSEVHTYRSSGPGGQHRNKVSSAVRLVHKPSGVNANGDESRSQHDNKRMALQRLRMNIALHVRRPVDLATVPESLPPVVAECLFLPRGRREAESVKRIQVGRKDFRYWSVAQYLLDLLEACQGRLADAAALLGVNTSNMVSVIKEDRHLFAAVQELRKLHGHGLLK